MCIDIRTATWDVVAWNKAATVMLTDFGAASRAERKMLRFIFLDPRMRRAQGDWESVARFVVSAFRSEAARAGAVDAVRPLVDELCARSPEFKAMWGAGEPATAHTEAVKHMRHPELGEIAFEYSAFAVDGRPDLSLLIYNPVTAGDARKIGAMVEGAAGRR